MKNPLVRFLVRWLVCSLGLFITSGFLANSITFQDRTIDIIIGGLVLAIINTFLKPILVLLSLPAIVFSLGLFMIIVNGITVFLASKLYTPLHLANFWVAIFAGMVIGLVNYLVVTILER
ncbi:MAG: phage holin family protein [Patescibacteria group bacterium]|jgi:putative membrane protein|nr:phage holin family protein [Patescibacteria group bacterium]